MQSQCYMYDMYITLVYIFVSLVQYWENFAFMLQILWKKSNSDFSSKEFCHGRRRHGAGVVKYPQSSDSGARGAQHKSVGAVFFVCLGRPRNFPMISPPFLLGFGKIYFTTKFIDFSTSNRIDEMNFRNPKKIRIWGSHVWGCWHLVVETAKGIQSESTFHRYHWFAGKHFPVSCAAGIPPFFCTGFALSRATGIFWIADPLANILPTR